MAVSMKSFTTYIRQLSIAVWSSHWYPIIKGNIKIIQELIRFLSFLLSCKFYMYF